jgi:preprotein translocase subunit SecF
MKILKYKRIYLTISAMLVIFSLGMIAYFGLNLGIDFKGGTIYEIKYSVKKPLLNEVKKAVSDAGIAVSVVQKVGDSNFTIKTPELSDELKNKLDRELKFNNEYQFKEVKLKTISPSVSSEFVNKSIWAIILVVIIIVLFIAYVFRGVSRPVSSYKYGLIAIVALLHDVIIPTGIFALLGSKFVEYQIDVLFVTAILAILGYSVNDTIVVFDRVRENLKLENNGKGVNGKKFEEVVGKSLDQTIRRSVFTSLTTLIVIGFLYFMGGENTKPFALVLGIGVIAGTYSSIFIASPLLTYVEKF